MPRYAQRWQQPSRAKHLDLDWNDAIRLLEMWDALEPGTRARIARLKTGDALQPGSLGADAERLEAAGVLDITLNRATARLARSGQPFVRMLRALERHDLVDRHDRTAFIEYSTDHLTSDDRRHLASSVTGWASEWKLEQYVTSVGWVRRFLDGPHKPPFGPDPAGNAALTIVRWFIENPTWLPLRELPAHLPRLAPAELNAGLRLCFERFLLFPAFRRPDRTVMIGLWPTVAKRLAEPVPQAPLPFQPETEFEGAYLVDDMTVILVAASASPLRLRKTDRTLFQRTHAELEDQLVSLPDWLTAPQWFSDAARVDRARETLETAGLLVRSGHNLKPSKEAPEWLALDDGDRLRSLLDAFRAAEARRSAPPPSGRLSDQDEEFDDYDLDDALDDEFDDDWMDDENSDDRAPTPTGSVRGGLYILPHSFEWLKPDQRDTVMAAVRAAFASLNDNGSSPILEFLVYRGRTANPLLDDDQLKLRLTVGSGMVATVENTEDFWGNVLGDLCYERLLPLGGIAIGVRGGKTGIRLTAAGRYLLGLADGFEYRGAPRSDGAVIVQPNFDVVFTAPSPRAEASLARFAERAGSRVGVLFRITRSSVHAAAAAGLTPEQAITALKEVSSRPLPDNVAREVGGWFAECRRVALAPALLIRCPDPETAARVLAAGGRTLRPISETLLELVDVSARTRVIKKLRGLGVFVDEASPARPGRRPRR